MRGRPAALIATVVAVAILAGTAFILFANPGGGGLNSRSNRKVNRQLIAGSKELKSLQDQSNEARESISSTFDLLDKVFNAIRAPGGEGLAEAKTAWEGAPRQMEASRLANKSLPDLTRKIVEVSSESREDIRELFPNVATKADRDYLRALDKALESLINTEVEYSAMNQRIAGGFVQYESLFERTDKFFQESAAGKYRSQSEAAQVYAIGTSDLIDPLKSFRAELDLLERKAAESGAGTTQAFRRAAALRP